MKNRDFRRLPFDRKFELTDGIYNYILTKFKLNPTTYDIEGRIMYQIRIKGGSIFTESFAVFEDTEKSEEYPYREYPKLTYSAGMGGFRFNGDFYMPWSLSKKNELKFVTEMDLKKYMKKQFSINTLLAECDHINAPHTN